MASYDTVLRITEENMRFYEKVRKLSGENLNLCFQCGACSSSCPLTFEMDLLPSTVIRLVQLGREEVLNCKTIWVCSTCFNCTVRCPRGLDVAKVMEALRQLVLRRGVDRMNLSAVPDDRLREAPQIALVSSLRKFTS